MSTSRATLPRRISNWVRTVRTLAIVGVATIGPRGMEGLPDAWILDPWDRTIAFATILVSLPTFAWFGLILVNPRSRALDYLDPLIVCCLPMTGFLWFYAILRLCAIPVPGGF